MNDEGYYSPSRYSLEGLCDKICGEFEQGGLRW